MKRILQVVWTGTGWDLLQPLLDHKLLPTLARLENSGCRAQLTSLEPQVTVQLAQSILSGQPAWAHGIAHPLRLVDHDKIRCNTLSDAIQPGLPGWMTTAGHCSVWVGWPHLLPGSVPGQHMVHRGYGFQDTGGEDDFSLHECQVLPDDISHEQLQSFFPQFAAQDIVDDPMTPWLRHALAHAASLQACATRLLQRSDWKLASVRFDLGDRMMRMFGDCHPPLNQTEELKRLLTYQNTVTGAYRFMDMMLARLVELAGPDCIVMVHSDKGTARDAPSTDPAAPAHRRFRSDHDHRGFLAITGNGIKQHQPMFAASILDIAPTILVLAGIRPEGLMGRVLGEALDQLPVMKDFPESVTFGPLQPPDEQLLSGVVADYVAHGDCQDIEDITPQEVRTESDLCMALNMMQNGAASDALILLDQLSEGHPGVRRYVLHRARCHLMLGQPDKAQALAEQFMISGEPDLHAHLLLGRIALSNDDTDLALVHFFQAEQMQPDDAVSHCQIGDAYRRASKLQQARDAFSRALSLDPMCGAAHLGLARIALIEEDYEAACAACCQALESEYRLPDAHYHLGVSLAKLQKIAEAITAFETCLQLSPASKPAHEWLASLYRYIDEGHEKASMHKALAMSKRT